MNRCSTLLAVVTTLIAQPIVLAAERPNVLFVAVDDMRCDAGCYGHSQAITPNIDRLAKMGVRFDRAYCQQALCNPSRASLLSGRRPDSLGVWNLTTGLRDADPNLVTLPQLFKQNGYATQGIGKIFHNWRTEEQGDPRSWSVPAMLHYARHDDDLPISNGNLPTDTATAPRCMCLDVPDSAYFDGRIADHAVAALQTRAKDKRAFFLAVGFWKPHLPFNPPAKYWKLYDRDTISMPEHPEQTQDVPKIALHDNREIIRAAGKDGLSTDEIRELRHGYLAGISFLDAQLGKVLDELERQDLAKNTVIVFWSDHGFHLGENSLWCKTSNFEHDARVPLIVASPGLATAGEATSSFVELIDLYPTLTELCGLPIQNELDGTSLVPILKNPSATVKQASFTQHPRPAYYKDHPEFMGVSVRTSRYRYTEWRQFDTGVVTASELYDHQTDPGETKNVVAAANDNILAPLRTLLQTQFPNDGWPATDSADVE